MGLPDNDTVLVNDKVKYDAWWGNMDMYDFQHQKQ